MALIDDILALVPLTSNMPLGIPDMFLVQHSLVIMQY